MRSIPVYDETAPIACTIGHEEIPGRLELLERMQADLTGIDRTDDGLLLHFPARADIEARVREFIAEEKRCCQFWGFAVDSEARELTLRWEAPPAGADLLDRVWVFFAEDESLESIPGLF